MTRPRESATTNDPRSPESAPVSVRSHIAAPDAPDRLRTTTSRPSGWERVPFTTASPVEVPTSCAYQYSGGAKAVQSMSPLADDSLATPLRTSTLPQSRMAASKLPLGSNATTALTTALGCPSCSQEPSNQPVSQRGLPVAPASLVTNGPWLCGPPSRPPAAMTSPAGSTSTASAKPAPLVLSQAHPTRGIVSNIPSTRVHRTDRRCIAPP